MSPYVVVARRLGGSRAEINSYSTKRGACVCIRSYARDLLISIAGTPFCAPREKLNCAGLTYVTRTGKREIAKRRAANKRALEEIHRIWLRHVCAVRRAHPAVGNPVRARVRKSARSRAHGYPLSLAMRVHLERGAVAAPSPRVNALVERGHARSSIRAGCIILVAARGLCWP
jgi:hypothetical protein